MAPNEEAKMDQSVDSNHVPTVLASLILKLERKGLKFKCHKCGGEHSSSGCKVEPTCSYCKGKGHFPPQCINRLTDSMTCQICAQFGHLALYCKLTPKIAWLRCQKCGQMGHLLIDCKENYWKRPPRSKTTYRKKSFKKNRKKKGRNKSSY